MWSARARLKRNTAQLAGSNSASSNAISATLRIRYVHRTRTPAVPRKSTQFMGPEGYFSRTGSTPNSSSSVCKSAAYFIDSQLMCTSEDIANWRRRTRQ